MDFTENRDPVSGFNPRSQNASNQNSGDRPVEQAIIRRHLLFCSDETVPEAPGVENVATAVPNLTQQSSFTHPYPAYRSDPLAADKPGDELLPEASVWKIYKREATEYDNELVKGRNENLDTMLIFAALFSAILTAFLIESTSLLREDPAEISATLLLLLVQSQLGVANVSNTSLDSLSFSPTSSARWVNGLWFTALAVSLAAALLAMLAKEWLDAFTTSHKRAPYTFAITRQARLDGFEAWRAPHIMDLLPTLLHLSLLLFALGLVLYIWLIDHAIAIILSVITCITFLFYLWTIATVDYIKIKWTNYSGIQGTKAQEDTSVADVQALAWLGRNARDQESSDSAYQAIAGLRCRKMNSPRTIRTYARESKRLGKDQQFMTQFFQDLGAYFDSTLTQSPRELAKCKGENIIRYLQAFPEIVAYTGTYVNDPSQELGEPSQGQTPKLQGLVNRFLYSISMQLDRMWSGAYRLSPITYAYVASAEMRFIQEAIIINILGSSAFPDFNKPNTDGCEATILQGVSLPRLTHGGPTDLWSRYLETVACATSLVLRCLHYSGTSPSALALMAPMNIHLSHLLRTIKTTATFMRNPSSSYFRSPHNGGINPITHFPWGPGGSQPYFVVALNNLLGVIGTPSPILTEKARMDCASAMSAIASLYIRDWRASHHWQTNPTSHEAGNLEKVLNQLEVDDPIGNVLAMTVFAAEYRPLYVGKLGDQKTIEELLDNAMGALLGIVMTSSSGGYLVHVGFEQLSRLIELQVAQQSTKPWPGYSRDSLIRILATKLHQQLHCPRVCETIWGSLFYSWHAIVHRKWFGDFNPVPLLLRVIQQTPGRVSEVELLLVEFMNQLEDLIKQYSNPNYKPYPSDELYLAYFASGQGFMELAAITCHPDYVRSVTRTVRQFCNSSRVHKYKWVISSAALPGFLTALFAVFQEIQAAQVDVLADDMDFIKGAMDILNSSLHSSEGSLDERSGYMAVKIVQYAYKIGGVVLEKAAGGVIARYFELPLQTEEEATALEAEW